MLVEHGQRATQQQIGINRFQYTLHMNHFIESLLRCHAEASAAQINNRWLESLSIYTLAGLFTFVVRLVEKNLLYAILSSIQACLSPLSIPLKTLEELMLMQATFTMATND